MTVAEVLTRTAARLAGIPEWVESPNIFEVFGELPSSVKHKCFAVGVPATQDTHEYRSNPRMGLLAVTTLGVRWSWQLSPKDLQASYLLGLAGELELIRSLLAQESGVWPTDLKFLLQTATRIVTSDGEWMIGTILFHVRHTITLQ